MIKTAYIFRSITIVILVLGLISACSRAKSTQADIEEHDTDSGEPATDAEETPLSRMEKFELQNETVFGQQQMLEYHITMDAALVDELEQNGDDELYRPASLHVVGDGIDETFEQVGYRLKGAYSLHHCWDDFGGQRNYEDMCARISRKIKFNKYDEDARLFGLKKINLHAMMSDETKLREKLGYKLFNDFGLTAPRTAYAKLFVNNEYIGLFLTVEAIDGRFTAYHYPEEGDGNLYKEIWPKSNISEEAAFTQLRTNDDSNDPDNPPDVSDFISFGNAVSEMTSTDFDDKIANWLDIDHTLRYIAVDRAFKNWDGIMGFYSPRTSHNFYWYHHQDELGQFSLVPWDLDHILPPFDIYMDPKDWCSAAPIPDWNEIPLNCNPRPGCTDDNPVRLTPPHCDNLLSLLAVNYWDRFNEIGKEFLTDYFVYETMNSQIAEWQTFIAPAIEDDPLIDSAQWQSDVERFQGILQGAIWDFSMHIEQGVIEELNATPPTPSEIDDPIAEGGLNLTDVSYNFEFESTDNWKSYIHSESSTGTTLDISPNTENPISGNTDMLLEANFSSLPKTYDEYCGVVIDARNDEELDLTQMREIWVTIAASQPAEVRLEMRSSLYASEWGGIWPTFISTLSVSTEPTAYRVELDSLTYPQWAKSSWTDGQGWDYADGRALNELLAHISGISFQLFPQYDPSGQMDPSEQALRIQIDNIIFQ